MLRITLAVEVDAAPAEVWQDLADIASHREWMSDAREIDFLSEQRAGAGTQFAVATRIGPFRLTDRMEITEWRPQAAMSVRHHGFVTGEGRFTLAALPDDRARLCWSEVLRFPWWLGGLVGERIASPILLRTWRKSLRAFAARHSNGEAGGAMTLHT